MSSCIPVYLLDADNPHSTTALASLCYIWSRLASGWWSDQISRERRRRANTVRSRLSSNWRNLKLKVDNSHWGEHWTRANGVCSRLPPIWAVISSSLFRLRSCKQEKGLTVAARPMTLHHFLYTVLPKKKVTRRLAAATVVAQPHDNGRPGTSGIWKRDLQRSEQWQTSIPGLARQGRDEQVDEQFRDWASGW